MTTDDAGRKTGLALVLLSTAAYGTTPIFAKVAYSEGIAPTTLLALRFLVALGLFSFLGRAVPLRTRVVLWGLGLIFVSDSICYFLALQTISASRAAILLYVYPVIVTLLATIFGIERLTLGGALAAFLAFLGAALTAGGTGGSSEGRGVVLTLLAALLYASFIVLTSRFAASAPPAATARSVAEVGVVLFTAAALVRGEWALPTSPRGWGAILGIGVISTVVAHLSFLAGLARVGPGRTAVASSLEAVFTVLLAFGFLGEALSARQWVGGLLILSAVALHNRHP